MRKLKSLKTAIVMANFKWFYSAVETTKKVMDDWSDEEYDNIEMVILPSENDLLNDVRGTNQLQPNIPKIE